MTRDTHGQQKSSSDRPNRRNAAPPSFTTCRGDTLCLHTLLPAGRPEPYIAAMDDLTLPPELERFADEAIASGRYRDRSEVLAAGVGLLQRQEVARAAFIKTLEDAEAESERDGWLTSDEVHAEMSALIEEARRAKA
jgi:putative addiction module CopG family antidote